MMKSATYIVVSIVLIKLLAISILLIYSDNPKRYFLWVDFLTGVSIVSVSDQTLISKKCLKNRRLNLFIEFSAK